MIFVNLLIWLCFCFSANDVHDEPIFKDRIIPQPLPENHRSKRSVSDNKYYIEVLVAVDRKMKLYHDTKLQNYVLTLMSIVSYIFQLRFCD